MQRNDCSFLKIGRMRNQSHPVVDIVEEYAGYYPFETAVLHFERNNAAAGASGQLCVHTIVGSYVNNKAVLLSKYLLLEYRHNVVFIFCYPLVMRLSQEDRMSKRGRVFVANESKRREVMKFLGVYFIVLVERTEERRERSRRWLVSLALTWLIDDFRLWCWCVPLHNNQDSHYHKYTDNGSLGCFRREHCLSAGESQKTHRNPSREFRTELTEMKSVTPKYGYLMYSCLEMEAMAKKVEELFKTKHPSVPFEWLRMRWGTFADGTENSDY